MSNRQKQITLKAWAEANFDPPPSNRTLWRWARDCCIYPEPEKVGRDWRVDPNARYVGRNTAPKRLAEVIRGTKAA